MAKTAGPRNVTAFTQWRREGVDQAGCDDPILTDQGIDCLGPAATRHDFSSRVYPSRGVGRGRQSELTAG
jgi:hypothetical protein